MRAGWRASFAALALTMLSACASGPATQTAKVDPKPGDGIGGTGIAGQTMMAGVKAGDGIGGTGILGTISGFGSIIVNGLKLEYDRTTAMEIDGRPASLEELKVGQVVKGLARAKNGKLTLDSLEMQHAVTGPIERIDHDTETLAVLGQSIRVNLGGDKAAIDSFKTLTTGDMVSVSGLRQADGTIVATRVDQQPDDGRIVLRGIAGAASADSVTIGGLTLSLSKETTVSPVKAGGRVFVSGRMINGQFVADVVVGAAPLPFGDGVKDVSIEAYAPNATGGPIVIEGIAVDGAGLPGGTATGDRLIITGRVVGADRVTATTIDKVRTFVTILRAKGSLRPAAIRPDANGRPERMSPPRPPDRPNIERPQRERPERERPDGVPMV
ncbi:MAG: DUF5666 domain-containing protein [Rhodospirillaceae bacterium]|nr:DUF5666 domain-containing protein [Rhodospirillaceae bacterium]